MQLGRPCLTVKRCKAMLNASVNRPETSSESTAPVTAQVKSATYDFSFDVAVFTVSGPAKSIPTNSNMFTLLTRYCSNGAVGEVDGLSRASRQPLHRFISFLTAVVSAVPSSARGLGLKYPGVRRAVFSYDSLSPVAS